MQTLCSGVESAHIQVNFFSFKIEGTYTFTQHLLIRKSFSVLASELSGESPQELAPIFRFSGSKNVCFRILYVLSSYYMYFDSLQAT